MIEHISAFVGGGCWFVVLLLFVCLLWCWCEVRLLLLAVYRARFTLMMHYLDDDLESEVNNEGFYQKEYPSIINYQFLIWLYKVYLTENSYLDEITIWFWICHLIISFKYLWGFNSTSKRPEIFGELIQCKQRRVI